MIRKNDLILLLVLFSSMLAGILAPDFGALFQPFPLYLMMLLLFTSLLPIRPEAIWDAVRSGWRGIALLAAVKIFVLPVAVFYLFRWAFPEYALGALLLTGISTGVVAPFISNLVGGNSARVLVLVVVTSPLVPFTLPVLVKVLSEQALALSLGAMIRMLALVVFVPVLAVEVLRRKAAGLLERIDRRRFPISLTTFAMINLAVFSRYSEFFHQKPGTIAVATGLAAVLAAIYLAAGFLLTCREPLDDRLAAAVSLGNMNNVLVIVFAARFFSPLEPTLAAMYMIPFFGLIVPLRIYRRWKEGGSQENQGRQG
ncbi:MAG: bile acid:sodium symporter family protein [Thermodesulfobacteriota bacterium]